eukprot:m.181401 g.181401  ORF g.181401 m.181401 type:complete len:983 (+) comp32062_c0_seq1:170-3118(+)
MEVPNEKTNSLSVPGAPAIAVETNDDEDTVVLRMPTLNIASSEDDGGLNVDAIKLLQRLSTQASMDNLISHEHDPKQVRTVRDQPHRNDYPNSYKVNTTKEQLSLKFVANFVRQYVHLYNNRTPLFITPPNECGVPKFVCTTIRPTLLPFKDLYTHSAIASFVADYITYEFLPTPTEPPPTLPSPTTTMWTQRGNCFDMSILLCSLLQGAGYDAYCVHGYANREVTMLDRSRREVAVPTSNDTDNDATPKSDGKKPNKYLLQSTRKIKSKYNQEMDRRAEEKQKEEMQSEIMREAAERRERRKPTKDPLWGLRVHCWVVVLQGKRGVPEDFFIEPSLGETVSTSNASYLGIETLFNSSNYWVNMQDCTQGLGDMSYDLGDSANWEYVFPDPLHPLVSNGLPGSVLETSKSAQNQAEVALSWVNEITLEPQAFETRCPHGEREYVDENAQTKVYSEYHRPDGMVKSITFFKDYELEQATINDQTFQHRNDDLIRKKITFNDDCDQIDEYYKPGRTSNLFRHVWYKAHRPRINKGRIMFFYDDARVEGLYKRERNKCQLRETFRGRKDLLIKRVVDFAGSEEVEGSRRRLSLGGPTVPKVVVTFDNNTDSTEIEVVTDTYARDPRKPANEDICEVSFYKDVEEENELIFVKYHRDKHSVTAETREIRKPRPGAKQITKPAVTEDNINVYTTDMKRPQLRNFENNQIYQDLLAMETRALSEIKASLIENDDILRTLKVDDAKLKLNLSFYDTLRNAEAKERRKKLEQDASEEATRRAAMERDYLAPFLVRLNKMKNGFPGLTEKVSEFMSDEIAKNKPRTADSVDELDDAPADVNVWRKDNEYGWHDTLLTTSDAWLNIFVHKSGLSHDMVDDLKMARKQRYANDLYDHCILDLTERNIDKGNRISAQIDQEKKSLADKQMWYLQNQTRLQEDQENEYVSYCSQLIFRITILEERLKEHKEKSKNSEFELEDKLHQDARLEFLTR